MKKKRSKLERTVELADAEFESTLLPPWPDKIPTNLFLLAILGIFLFRQVFLHPGQLMWANDIIRFTLAGRFAEWNAIWRDGVAPFWDPTIFCGMSSTGDQARGLTNPLTWIHWLLPFPQLFGPLACLVTLLGAWGMFLFVRERGSTALGAFFAAAAFAMSGKVAGHLFAGHLFLVATVLSLPWMLWGVELILNRRNFRATVLFSLALVLGASQGAVQMFYFNLLFVGVYVAVRLYDQPPQATESRWNHLKRLASGGVIGGLLAAPWWFPVIRQTLLLGARTQDAGYGFTTMASARPADLLRHMWPFAGTPTPRPFANDAELGFFWETASYPGVATLALAVISLIVCRKDRTLLVLAAFAAILALISLGPHTPLHKAAYYLLPGFSLFRAPARLLFYSNLVLALLAGTLLGRKDTATTAWWSAGGLLAIVQLVFLVTLGVNQSALVPGAAAWQPLILLVALSAVTLLFAYHRLSASAWKYTCLGVLILELVLLWPAHVSTASMKQLFPSNPAAEFLAKQDEAKPFRVWDITGTIPQQVAAKHGLEIITGYHPGIYSHQLDFYKKIWREDQSSIIELDHHRVSDMACPAILDLMNVEYLVTYDTITDETLEPVFEGQSNPEAPAMRVYQRKTSLPRAFLVNETRPSLEGTADLDSVCTMDPRTTAIVSENPFSGTPATTPLSILSQRPGFLTLEAKLDESSFVVLSESWHPDWQAYDNGKPIDLQRVNHAQIGTLLEPGEHIVHIRYVPWDFYLGVVVALLTSLGVASATILRLRSAAQPAQCE